MFGMIYKSMARTVLYVGHIQRLAESASAFLHVRVLSAHGPSPRLVSILSGPHEPGFQCIYQPFEPRLALKILHPNPHAPQETWLSIGLFLIGYFPFPANTALQIRGRLHQNGNSAAEGSTAAAANFISKFEKKPHSRQSSFPVRLFPQHGGTFGDREVEQHP